MKIQVFILLLLFVSNISCNDFLEEASQDEVRPSTVDELESLLLGDVYPKDPESYLFIDLLTDDIQCNGLKLVWGDATSFVPFLENNRVLFTWDWEPLLMKSFSLWENSYKKIMGCNVVLDELDDVAGSVERKAFLRGQCLTLRAFYYFLLVNYFGLPYNFGDPKQNLGVPLKLDAGVRDEYFKRASVVEVYKQIEKDLLEGIQLMEQNPYRVSVYEISHLAAKVLLSRVYLYMEEWDKTIDICNQFLQERSGLSAYVDFSSIGGEQQGRMESGVYDPKESKEIIWLYRGASWQVVNEYSLLLERPPYGASDQLIGLYEDSERVKDLRKQAFVKFTNMFSTYTGPLVMNRSKDEYQLGLRTAEVYLNRAEACIHKFEKNKSTEIRDQALRDLNTLRAHRYDTRIAPYVEKNYNEFGDLLKFCREERRRELCFEEYHRWFDLRRYGMPELKHVFINSSGIKQEFVLQNQAKRYVLPIPQAVIEANPALEQNLQ